MGQDQSAEHLQHGSSERTRQGSFRQQCDRYRVDESPPVFFHGGNHETLSVSVSVTLVTQRILSDLKDLIVIIITAGHFLYVTVPDGGLTDDWAAFQSPHLEPTNSSHPCKVKKKVRKKEITMDS